MINKALRSDVHLKYKGHCAYCGEIIGIKSMQIDHMIPKSNFFNVMQNRNNHAYFDKRVPIFLRHLTINDVDHIDNLYPSCRRCNNYKGTYGLELFRWELEQQLIRAEKYSVNYRMAKKYGLVKEIPKKIVFYFEKIEKRKDAIKSHDRVVEILKIHPC